MKHIVLLAAASLALAACNNDDNYVDEPVAVHISATIGNNVKTRASETSWASGDQIGVTMFSGTTSSNMVIRYDNMKYTTESGDGTFTGIPMYFENKTKAYTIRAYYPFMGTEGTELLNSIEFSTDAEHQKPEEQPKIDILSVNKSSVKGSNPVVNLTFSHQMSKLTLIFKSGKGMDVSKITSYTISSLVLDGTFTPSLGTCTALKTGVEAKSLNVILPTEEGKPEEVTSSLILFPQTMSSKTLALRIDDSDDQYYEGQLSFSSTVLQAGRNYQFTITVNKTGLTISDSTIEDWTTDESDKVETGASSAD